MAVRRFDDHAALHDLVAEVFEFLHFSVISALIASVSSKLRDVICNESFMTFLR